MSDLKIYKKTPFTPGNTVNYSHFVGRHETIDKILRYLQKILDGDNSHF